MPVTAACPKMRAVYPYPRQISGAPLGAVSMAHQATRDHEFRAAPPGGADHDVLLFCQHCGQVGWAADFRAAIEAEAAAEAVREKITVAQQAPRGALRPV